MKISTFTEQKDAKTHPKDRQRDQMEEKDGEAQQQQI